MMKSRRRIASVRPLDHVHQNRKRQLTKLGTTAQFAVHKSRGVKRRLGSKAADAVRADRRLISALPPKPEMSMRSSRTPLCAISGLMHRSKLPTPNAVPYSITSSVWASNVGEIVRPSAFAVFILISTGNLVGCSTGRSAGLAPLRILST